MNSRRSATDTVAGGDRMTCAVGIVIFADLDEQGHHPSAKRPSPSLGMRLTRAGATAPVPPEVSAVFQAHWRYGIAR